MRGRIRRFRSSEAPIGLPISSVSRRARSSWSRAIRSASRNRMSPARARTHIAPPSCFEGRSRRYAPRDQRSRRATQDGGYRVLSVDRRDDIHRGIGVHARAVDKRTPVPGQRSGRGGASPVAVAGCLSRILSLDLPLGLGNGIRSETSRGSFEHATAPWRGGRLLRRRQSFCLAFNFSAPRAFVRPWPATVHPDAQDAAPRAHCSVIQVEVEQPKSEPGPPQDPQRGH